MKIILSRKGFDSTSGGVPSPIFPDGRILSLPIPDKQSRISYKDICGTDLATMGELVEQLASIPPAHRAHLDPDLSAHSIPRLDGWRPIFGQVGSAEGHLQNEGVGPGDIFLFFGLFRRVERSAGRWRYVRGSRPVHLLFGWLQVEKRVRVSTWPESDDWARYHPHFQREPHDSNVIYVSSDRLTLPKVSGTAIAGSGVFPSFSQALQLTWVDADRPSHWLLPEWFYPDHRGSTLTYHGAQSRWQKADDCVILNSASRGQEFVLNCKHYPEAVDWVEKVVRPAPTQA